MIPGMEGERHDTMDDEDEMKALELRIKEREAEKAKLMVLSDDEDDASPQDEQIRNVDFIDINEEAEEDNMDL